MGALEKMSFGLKGRNHKKRNSIGETMKKVGLLIVLALALAASFANTPYEAAGVNGVEFSAQPAGKDATVNFNPINLAGFTYVVGNGPSAVQSFAISGSGYRDAQGALLYMLNVSGSNTFPISDAPGGPFVWNTPFNVTPDESGNIAATFYVRLNAELNIGDYQSNVLVNMVRANQSHVRTYEVPCRGCVTPHQYLVHFEDGTKDTDASGEVVLNGIEWNMTDARIGTSADDYKVGNKSARLNGSATSSITMLQDKSHGAGNVTFLYRRYADQPQTSWVVEYITPDATQWTQVGLAFTAPETDEVQTFEEFIGTTENVRICIREATGSGAAGRGLNIDNIAIDDYYDFFEDESYEVITDYRICISGSDANYSKNPHGPAPDNIPNDATVLWHERLTLFGDGPWSLTSDVYDPNGGGVACKGELDWTAVKYNDTWHTAQMIDNQVFFEIEGPLLSPGNDIEVLLARQDPPTLPVTLSHFSATMTAQNYVNLTWVSQTESNLMGYNVLRSGSEELGTASQICAMIPATNSSEAQTYTYLDKELVEDGTYYYWLQSVDMCGTTGFYGPASVIFSITGDTGTPAIPTATQLEDAYPNPFNPNTTLRYQLKDAGNVKIDIYNQRGQLVRSFVKSHDAAGYYNILWDGCDGNGRALASGVYLYKMTSDKYSGVKKLVLQK